MNIAQVSYRQSDGGFSNEPLKVNNVGFYKEIGSNTPIGDEFYDDFLIIYNFSGKIDVWFGYDRISTKPGDVIIIPPGECHKFVYFAKKKCQYFWCHFSGTVATETANELLKKHGKIFNIGVIPSVSQVFENIYTSMDNNCDNVTNDLLYTLLFSIKTLVNSELYDTTNTIDILKSIIFIQNNYNKEISVDDLCAMCNISKYNFMHKFKDVTGDSVHKFLINYRMMRAKQLLANSDMSIKEVANQIGFNDNMYFSRAFKKHFGINPTDFKKQENEL